ncbi:MAG TPA: DUF4145 domain-containing protein [Stellaceae bacterium]|nr:DUF4145 domain-containing protein [Stellaceae bacterium]
MAKYISGAPTFKPGVVSLRCPSCRRNGSFSGFTNIADVQLTVQDFAGMRVCPNPECKELVFIIANGADITAYPAERLDFDPGGIPPKILASFEEALTDHANQCFKSSAIMVRRTLEEICADKGAKGNGLKERLTALQSVIVVPKELLDAADELRILGNDAAHLEARVYDDIGKTEVEAAIDLCKEILKAVYQLDSLVKRLKALKKTP